MTFIEEAQQFAAELGKVHAEIENGHDIDVDADDRFVEFANDLSARMISASKSYGFDFDDILEAIRFVEKIEDIHGSAYAANIDTDLPYATQEILTPLRVFEHMEKQSGKHGADTEIMLNGVKFNLEQAQMFYDALAGLNAEIAFGYLNHGQVNVENNYFDDLEFNPLEIPQAS
ncbi:hypothetical protein ACNE9Y_06990 [Pseudomonas sp. NY11226]|uniref:hypothetical protein n=1 Tax=Pseudomonas sp. NY11226 TaxID=3400362 RepID=UPI003A883427